MPHMDRSLRLCLIHAETPLCDAFGALGCEVLNLMPRGEGVLHLPTELAAQGFAPDLVLQLECLGSRLLVSGLHELDCPRLFWALDPHLNAFWQAAYARLFDLTLSTQGRSLTDLHALGARALHLPWYAPDKPFTPHAQRRHDVGFVGRLGQGRPVRTWLVEFLRAALPGRFETREGLDTPDMLAFYQATRLAPNESICGEVNFRLFEAAGCGCVVLAQDLGPEQAGLFQPGRELMVCSEALELAETAQLLLARPRLAEALGRAAWERAQADHLPLNRARSILALAAQTTRLGADAATGPRWLALAQAGLLEAGRTAPVIATVIATVDANVDAHVDAHVDANVDAPGRPAGAELIAQTLRRLDAQTPTDHPDPLLLAARLRVANALGLHAETEALLARCRDINDITLSLSLTCSMAALRRALDLGGPNAGRDRQASGLDLALDFARSAGVAPLDGALPPAVALLLAWAERLCAVSPQHEGCHRGGQLQQGQGQEDPQPDILPRRGGFAFDTDRHLPANGLECLYLASALAPDEVSVLRRQEAKLAGDSGSEVLRLGVLSELGLRARGDWRVGLATGLCDLRVFRPGAGLAELALAAQWAREQGQAEAFALALALADPASRIRRALASAQG